VKKLVDILKLLGTAVLLIGLGVAGKIFYAKYSKPRPFKPTATVTFESLLAGNWPKNDTDILITGGRAYALEIVEGTLTEQGTQQPMRDRRSYMVMVPYTWTKDSGPVNLIYAAKAWPGFRLEEVVRSPTKKARVFTAPWPHQKEITETFDKLGFKVVPNALLLLEPDPDWPQQ
jgi:hypothetical protein